MKAIFVLILIQILVSGHIYSNEIDADLKLFKTQRESVINWKNIDAEQWLDIGIWIKQRDIKDKNKNWKIEKRIKEHKEIIGTLIQCLGECYRFSSHGKTRARFKSKIYEGDEIETRADSGAWLSLNDGSLIRVAANSSVSFFEINFSKSEVFVSYRINKGHSYVLNRKEEEHNVENKAETDTAFYPLYFLEANREYFMRKEFLSFSDEEKLKYSLEANPGYRSQHLFLEEMLKDSPQNLKSKHLVITPNSSYIVESGEFHVFHETNGETYFKMNSGSAKVSLRGYNNTKLESISNTDYYSVNQNGSILEAKASLKSKFTKIEYLIKRVPSIKAAREIALNSILPIITGTYVSGRLGLDFDYYEWKEKQLNKHLDLLVDYSRRIETTNLVTSSKFFKDKKMIGMTDQYFQYTYSKHLSYLSSRNYNEIEKIKEFDKARYYLWVMKNGKNFISLNSRK